MIELIRIELGYCEKCRKPAQVGVFKVLGWQHSTRICASCMGGFSEQIDEAGTVMSATEARANGN